MPLQSQARRDKTPELRVIEGAQNGKCRTHQRAEAEPDACEVKIVANVLADRLRIGPNLTAQVVLDHPADAADDAAVHEHTDAKDLAHDTAVAASPLDYAELQEETTHTTPKGNFVLEL